MSGGVDSSTAAYLLLKKGYDVVGITLKLFDQEEVKENSTSCCGIKGVDDARAVASKLGIPFYALNYVDIFKKDVIDYFSSEYAKGRTPNPCLICNEKIKFKKLIHKAKSLGAHYLATGHYARIDYNRLNKRYLIKKARLRF